MSLGEGAPSMRISPCGINIYMPHPWHGIARTIQTVKYHRERTTRPFVNIYIYMPLGPLKMLTSQSNTKLGFIL